MGKLDRMNKLKRRKKKKKTRFAKLMTWKQKVDKDLYDDPRSEHYGRSSNGSDFEMSLKDAFRMYSDSMNLLTRMNAISK